jgi:hypothetical protein
MRRTLATLLLTALCLPLGCTVDDGPGTDLGPTQFTDIGAPCTSATFGTCSGDEICLRFGSFSDGYCTLDCSTTACPDGAVCQINRDIVNQPLCYRGCRNDNDCRRPGYLCSLDGACLPEDVASGGGVRPGTNDGGACTMPIQRPADQTDRLFGPTVPVSAINPGAVEAQVHMAIDPVPGRIVTTFADIRLTGGGIGVATSDDDGATFNPPLVIPTVETPFHNEIQTDPAVAIDSRGTIFITWLGFNYLGAVAGNFRVLLARSTDGGLTFSDLRQVSPPTEVPVENEVDKPWIAVSPVDDSIYVVWHRSDPNLRTSDIRLVRSTNGGDSWSAPITLSDNTSRPELFRDFPRVFVAADGRPYVVWSELGGTRYGSTANRVYLQRLATDGTKLGTNVRVSVAPNSPGYADATVAAQGDNVYVGFLSGTPRGDWDVHVAASLDGGRTFLPSVKVNDDTSCATHYVHQIVVDPRGNVHAVWLDNRYHPEGNVFHAMSPPAAEGDPLSFGRNTFVNSLPFPFRTNRNLTSWVGDYLGLVAEGNQIYATWSDPHIDLTSHIFFAKGTLP